MFTFYIIFLNNIVFILKYFLFMQLYIVYIYADFYIHVLAYLYWYKIYLYADLKFVQKNMF